MWGAVYGKHTAFLQQIMRKQSRQNPYGTWVISALGEMMGEEGVQLAAMYIGRRQGEVSQWVALRSIFEVCAREQGYEGGGGVVEAVVVTGGARRNFKDNLVGDVAGGVYKAEQE